MRRRRDVRPRRRAGRGPTRPDHRSRPTPSSGCPRPASAAPICGPTAASSSVERAQPMGHEYVGIVEEVGTEVTHDQARPVRRRVVLRLRQHLRDLPGRLPDLAASTASSMGTARHPGRAGAHPAGRRHPGRHPRCSDPDLIPACWPPPTCSAPAGSPPSPPTSAPARRSPSSVTARSACSACSPPSSSAPSGSSR